MPHKKCVIFSQKCFEKMLQCCVCYNERKFLSPDNPIARLSVRSPTAPTARINRFRRINLCGDTAITIAATKKEHIM
jgi:hypothetical protein